MIAGALAFLPLQAVSQSRVTPGLYRDRSGELLYVGPDVEPPDRIVNYFNPRTLEDGAAAEPSLLRLERAVTEKRLTVDTPAGVLGASLWTADERKRSAVLLIHGNEAATREMGYLIPFFVLNGINVISYDQRGTGESRGDWRSNGPPERASDILAILDALAREPLVDQGRIGLWGFSNGAWTAPIVATKRSIAFMILVGAPAGTIEDNIAYEVRERMLKDHFDEPAIAAAIEAVRAQIDALSGRTSWERARTLYNAATSRPWFSDTGMRPGKQYPPPDALAAAQRRSLLFDPAPILERVTIPTLALYGALDRSVDSEHDSAILRAAFGKAGMRDFTLHIYPGAGHSLASSKTGFDEDALPRRYVDGFPEVMLDWLRGRGFLMETDASRR